jgi:hypothetical protein
VDVEARASKDRFRAYAPEVTLLLWAVWNPVGTDVPINEYENYVPGVWKLLEAGADVDAVSAELTRIVDERMMGSGQGTERAAAETIKAWWYWRFDYPKGFEATP